MRHLIRYLQVAVLICFSSLISYGQPAERDKPASASAKVASRMIKGAFSSQQSARFDSTKVGVFLARYPDLKSYASDLKAFYAGRKYAYAWFEQDSLIEQAANLTGRVTHMQDDGISRKLPYLRQLDSLLYVSPNNAATQAELELMLSAQYFAYARAAWEGMPNSFSKASGWYLPRKKMAYGDLLDSLLRNPAYATVTTRPVYRQYGLLKTYLKKYYELSKAEPWQAINMQKLITPGDTGQYVIALKRRLHLLGDYKGNTLDRVFNEHLVDGIKSYQERNGLPATGKLDRATLASLNVPLNKLIEKLMINMERCRWLPSGLDEGYLGVNVPEFKLHVYHADSLLWSCNVVVGQTIHQTALFYGEVKYVVFSPYWNVPPGILKNEVIPGMKADPDYLSKHHMEITGYQNGTPVVRQKPGPDNSLGLVKFLFPNSYNIYLHDTPSKSLFGENSRAFSHGCIRVGEPARLASFLLKNDPAWDDQKINQAMHTGKEQYVTLNMKIPVFITYLTTFVDRRGKLNFRNDIYNLDNKLARMIVDR